MPAAHAVYRVIAGEASFLELEPRILKLQAELLINLLRICSAHPTCKDKPGGLDADFLVYVVDCRTGGCYMVPRGEVSRRCQEECPLGVGCHHIAAPEEGDNQLMANYLMHKLRQKDTLSSTGCCFTDEHTDTGAGIMLFKR